MIISILLILVGFSGLIFGANFLVDGSASLAKKNNIPDLIIGLTIVAFGTSAPELVVNSVASYNGLSDIVLANIIGSNNFNLFFILGIAALIYPIAVQSSTARREIPLSLIIAVLSLGLATEFFMTQNSEISRFDGLILLLFFFAFLYFLFSKMKSEKTETVAYVPKSNFKIWSSILIGFLGLIVGGKLVVDYSINVATELGVSQKIIGLTIISIGTSLPELVTSIVAATKKNSDIAIGNVIGSNIFNLLFILSISSLINPIQYNQEFNRDFALLIGGTLFLIIALVFSKRKKIEKWKALILVSFYLFYTSFLVMKEL